ncbi:hypothetical protein VTN49DRAFT_7755 [Thermomyces lanuginosus]|uniref:uncharacterized protein n=1 Tax=Thermomyces lanuginosus TaxID=5541 RepID=UPI003741FBB1
MRAVFWQIIEVTRPRPGLSETAATAPLPFPSFPISPGEWRLPQLPSLRVSPLWAELIRVLPSPALLPTIDKRTCGPGPLIVPSLDLLPGSFRAFRSQFDRRRSFCSWWAIEDAVFPHSSWAVGILSAAVASRVVLAVVADSFPPPSPPGCVDSQLAVLAVAILARAADSKP